MTKKLIDDVIKGGIKNNFYIYHRYSNEQGDFQIYQVKGHSGIDLEIHPRDLMVDICRYDISKNRVFRYNEYLSQLLDNDKATSSEIELISQELLSEAKKLPKSKEEPYIPF